MNKYIISLFIIFNSFVSFSQQTAVSIRTVRITNATTILNQNIPIGTIVLDVSEMKLFLATSSIESTETLTTASASFEILNAAVVNETTTEVITISEPNANSNTLLLPYGGTLLVTPVGGTSTITLLTTNVVSGKMYRVKKTNLTTDTVKVITETGLIEGVTSIETNIPYEGWVFQFDGTDWHIVGHI